MKCGGKSVITLLGDMLSEICAANVVMLGWNSASIGLEYGCGLLLVFFNIQLENVMREWNKK